MTRHEPTQNGEMLPPRSGRSAGQWIRYNWWKIFVHLLLVGLGVLNLYPFFWMAGTSFKSEQEASNNRLRPVPIEKYQLAEDFELPAVLPAVLAPGLEKAQGKAKDERRENLRHKLELIRDMQVNALEAPFHDKLAQEIVPIAPAFRQAKLAFDKAHARASELKEEYVEIRSTTHKLWELHRNFQAAREQAAAAETDKDRKKATEEIEAATTQFGEAVEKLEKLSGRPELPAVKQVVRRLDGPADVPDAADGFETLEAQAYTAWEKASEIEGDLHDAYLEARTEAVERETKALIDEGLILRAEHSVGDETYRTYWLTDKGAARDWPEDWDEPRVKIGRELWNYMTTSVEEFHKSSGQKPEKAREALLLLLNRGILEEVEARRRSGEPAYRLAEGARGPLFGPPGKSKLLPRQILALWGIHEENEKREESRNTFATHRLMVTDYQKSYGIDNDRLARAELEQLIDEGHMAPGTWQAINYWVVLTEQNFLLHFATSLIITIIVVLGSVLVSSMFGYALAKLSFPGKMLALGILISASVLPTEARMIPIFKMLLSVDLVRNLWGVIIWLTSFGVGHSLLMAGFFLTLPKEVDEAAEVDGAGVFRRFFDIGLPMARPIVTTVALFAFIGAWNNFLVPLLCTMSRPAMQPLAVAVYNFQAGHPGKWHQINAAAAIMIVPVIIMFLIVQRHVVKAIAVGAVKG